MRNLIALFVLLLGFAIPARADLILNVTLDYDQDRDNVGTQAVFNDLANALSHSLGQKVKLVMTQNAERVGERIRTGTYSIILAPSQLIGTAMRHGYVPVAKTDQDTSVVLVARKGSNITSVESAHGKSIALPHRESLVSYMVRGEMNAMGLSPSSYFGHLMYENKYGAVLYAMEIGVADVAAVKDSIAKEWIANNPGTAIVKTFTQVPLAGVVVSDKIDVAVRDKVRLAFSTLDRDLDTRLARLKMGNFEPADKPDFEYVSTRGFYSPEVIPGGNIVTAEQVKKLMSQGAPLFDVRSPSQYNEAHVQGAVNLPYTLNSPKEVEYDDSVDTFDLSKLPQDKNAPMIFQCNGAECWYSYKAARYMIKRGFKKVYWFRTGLPAWKAAGYPIQRGS